MRVGWVRMQVGAVVPPADAFVFLNLALAGEFYASTL